MSAVAHKNLGVHEHREIFATKLGLYPFNSWDGPSNSRFYFYQVGKRVVIVQQFSGNGGWCEYVGGATISVDKTLEMLQQMMTEE